MYNYRPHHREEPVQAPALIPANDCTTKCGIHRIDTRITIICGRHCGSYPYHHISFHI